MRSEKCIKRGWGNSKTVQGGRVAQWVRSLDLTAHTSLSPIRRRFAPGFVNYKKWCTRLAAASDKVYHLLAHGRWFSPGTPASSNTKTGRHDIAEILMKVALKHKKSKNLNQKLSNTYYKKEYKSRTFWRYQRANFDSINRRRKVIAMTKRKRTYNDITHLKLRANSGASRG